MRLSRVSEVSWVFMVLSFLLRAEGRAAGSKVCVGCHAVVRACGVKEGVKKNPRTVHRCGGRSGVMFASPRRPAPGLNKAENANENDDGRPAAYCRHGSTERRSEDDIAHGPDQASASAAYASKPLCAASPTETRIGRSRRVEHGSRGAESWAASGARPRSPLVAGRLVGTYVSGDGRPRQ